MVDLTCRRLADVQQNVERSMAHLDIMRSLLSGRLLLGFTFQSIAVWKLSKLHSLIKSRNICYGAF